jgi:hypothetical protein
MQNLSDGNFLNFFNYFLMEQGISRVYGAVDWVHGCGLPRPLDQ